jgi:hypothetical protein
MDVEREEAKWEERGRKKGMRDRREIERKRGSWGRMGEIGRKGWESMELRRKKKRMRPGEKMMDRETTINQGDTKEFLHYLLDVEEAIEINREAPEGEGRSLK